MQPEIIETIDALRDRLDVPRRRCDVIGLVPTMGALHAGHGALIDGARAGADVVVVSIFVNPIQFDRAGDYAAYRIDLDCDREFCAAHGADIIFAPSAAEMYPQPPAAFVEVTGLGDHLCGKFRPGHFRGVATVVMKLFQIVQPDRAWFGEKDAQQLAIVQRMVADLNLPVQIVPVPTVREPDGLALSSRNRRLTPQQRAVAPLLYQTLQAAANQIADGCVSAAPVQRQAIATLESEPQIRVEYLEFVDPATIQPVETISAPVRIAAAVWLGETRLIDNVLAPAAQ